MRTPDYIYNFITAPMNRFGIYTRRNCVDKATQIGKELVDISRSKTLTKSAVTEVIKKHAKGIRLPNLVTTREEVIQLSVRYGMPQWIAEARFDSMPEGYLAFQSQAFRGIFFSRSNMSVDRPDVISHELEHYFFENCFYKNLCKQFKYTKLGMGKRKHVSEEEGLKIAKLETYMLPKLLPPKLNEHFGTTPGQLEDFITVYSANKRGFLELLASDKFLGLKDQKRIDAQLRSFLRSFCNPKNGQVSPLKQLREIFKEEANAYTVSDRVIRYEADADCLTRIGVRKDIYKRAVKLLDKEIKIAQRTQKTAQKTGVPIKEIKTGMPSDCFVGSSN